MAQTNTLNPYVDIGKLLPTGLNAVITALPANPTQEDLLKAVVSFVQGIFYPTASTQVLIELYSISAHTVNSYRNDLVLNNNAIYDDIQMEFIAMLIDQVFTSSIAPDSLQDWISDVQNNIGISDLNIPQQIPLFLATAIGLESFNYWNMEINNPTSAWLSYFSGNNSGKNYMNTLLWNRGAMNGAICGYGSTTEGLVEPTINRVTNQMISALIGGLTITAGMVIFKWIPKITKPLEAKYVPRGYRNNNFSNFGKREV